MLSKIHLVSEFLPIHPFAMNRIKTLSLPLFTALALSGTAPLDAQVALQLSSQKTYRQNKKAIGFTGGSFNIRLNDGSVTSIGICNDQALPHS